MGNVFQHPETHPLLLDLVLLKGYGPEWLEWEPETVKEVITRDFGAAPSDTNMNKLQAVKTLHVVDTFWQDWTVFCWVAKALSGVPPDTQVMQVPTVEEAMIAVDTANKVREDINFSQELKDYLENVHLFDGIFVSQEPLGFVVIEDADDYPVDVAEIKKLWPFARKAKTPPSADTVTSEQLRRMVSLKQGLEEYRAQLQTQLPLLNHVSP